MNLSLLSDFERLTAAVLDRTATPVDIRSFNKLLRDYPELADVYFEQAQMHALLECRCEKVQECGIAPVLISREPEIEHLQSDILDSSSRLTVGRVHSQRFSWRWWKAVAVLALLLSGLLLWYAGQDRTGDPAVSGLTRDDPDHETWVKVVQAKADKGLQLPQAVPGKASLKEGMARIRMASGVEVAMVGPVSLVIQDAMQIRLLEGRVVTYVPPRAIGFRVYAPQLTVCDLGTVFGVTALTNRTDVFVFDGRVKVMDDTGKGIGLCAAGEGVRTETGKWPVKIGRYEGEAERLFAATGGDAAIDDGMKACNLMERIIQGGWDRFNLPVSESNIYSTQMASAQSLLSEEQSVSDLSPASSNSAPVVSHVRLAQRPESRLVDVLYDLAGSSAIITLNLVTNGAALPDSMVTALSGDVSMLVEPGTDRHILWQAAADWPEQLSTQMQACVTAWSVTQPPPVWVVDLTPGPDALRYETYYYTSEQALPAGGLTNDLYRTDRLVMRRVPACSALQGSPVNELGRVEAREDQHAVTLTQPFYMGVFEMTQWQWAQVMGTFPSFFTNSLYAAARPVELVSYNDIRGNVAGAGWPGSSAVDANSFMGRLRSRTGFGGFDLPTEAQWETSCRSGEETALNNGFNLTNRISDASLSLVGRYASNGGRLENGTVPPSSSITENGSAKVGSYLPNAWGLYDMHGNVWEWCRDWYKTGLGDDPVVDPQGAATGTYHVLRGGSWLDEAWMSRSACRLDRLPGYTANSFGFRLVIEEP
ncbi:MAG: SUMF1/EgtB/PvdO family nonheme iron enzyme [Kiritimatiellae bacterium]|jgi:formylglycine-generating enzyme required for sulfatase activity|nr:SUMF1/EgtB/PvdO family nonheme iron enzyme [Kiritimatiellia bacterium]